VYTPRTPLYQPLSMLCIATYDKLNVLFPSSVFVYVDYRLEVLISC
jgi:hypothetical protein